MKQLNAGSLYANRFEIEGRAGSGGMSTVYRAHDQQSGNLVALKLLHHGSPGRQESERFAREAQLLSEMHHPGIVTYVSHGELPDGERYLAMEWLEGEDLGQRLVRGPLPLGDCCALLKSVADALAVTHFSGIVHRDLKPTNLFLVEGEVARVKVLDFGIARRGATSHVLTQTGMIVGTPEYMAPEQARGVRELTPAADVFSLGCVLYECLTGQPPFVADHIAAVLVRILFEEPAPVEERRLGIPAPLVELVRRLLAKDPAQRPADAAALRAELTALGEVSALALATTLASPRPTTVGFAEHEQSLVSVVLAGLPENEASLNATLRLSDVLPDSERQAILQSVQTLGVVADFLASGALVITVPALGSATDQATRAARAALLAKEGWPEAVVVMATGRGTIRGRTAVGEVVERAALSLKRGSQPNSCKATAGVLLDGLSAKLLQGRFVQTPQPDGALLLHEAREVDASRLLLGKPTSCVGREMELAILDAHLLASIEESEARGVLVTAPPGIGKSRLRHEFMRLVEKKCQPITCLVGRGDLMSARAPYGLLRETIRKLCGVNGSEPLETQRQRLRARVGQHLTSVEQDRVVLFIGELCNVQFQDEGKPLLKAARQEPKFMGDCMRHALRDWLAAECAAAPVVLVIDDLQWSDDLTVSFISDALRDQARTPLFVLSFARPEVHRMLPSLWQSEQVFGLQLKGLSKKACERLIRQVLGMDVLPDLVARAVEQSAGNALFLEELIRAIGEGALVDNPETVVAMLQARIGQFEPGLRRAVRAASVFGQTFFGGGVVELLGISRESSALAEVDKHLEMLVDAEVIELYPDSRLAGEKEYGFRHALVREAAYALLTDNDLTTGHRRAAHYLERVGSLEPLVLAAHYRRGGEMACTVPLYMRAADEASRLWALPEARNHYAAAHAVLRGLADSVKHHRYTVDVILRMVQIGILADPIELNLARLEEAKTRLGLLRDSGHVQPEDHRRGDRVELLCGKLHYYQGHYVEAIASYERLLPASEAHCDESLLAILSQSIGAALLLQGQAAKGRSWLARAVAHEGLLETDYDRLRARSSLAASLVLGGHYREGMALQEQVLARAAESQRPAGLALAHGNQAIMLRFCGDFAKLLENAEMSLERAQKSGDLMLVYGALNLIAWAYSFRGQPQEAKSYLLQAHKLLRESGQMMLFTDWFTAADAEIALRAGDLDGAITLAGQIVPSFRKEERLLALGLAEQVWGLALGYRDRSWHQEADSHLAAALQVMETSGQRLGAAILRLEWAQLCRHRGDPIRTAALRAQAVEQFEFSGCAHLLEGIEQATAGKSLDT